MKAEFYREQVQEVLKMIETGQIETSAKNETLSAPDYLDLGLHEKEKQLFKRLPIIVGHSSQLANSGDYFVYQKDKRSWLIVRGKDGVARAFLNYCRHRGTKLKQDGAGNCKHRLVCPYHAWTYNSEGELIGVPRSDLFPDLDKKSRGLKQGSLQEAYGLLWLTEENSEQEPIDSYLGGLKSEFAELGMENFYLYFDKTRELKANWKFPIFAFLEAYHLAVLHKDSIGEFFHGNLALSERIGRHFRSFVPRKNALELKESDWSETNISEYITPTNIVFPNVCMIAHPTSLSLLMMFPGEEPGRSTWRHMLLVPEKPESDNAKAHYQKTITVLDELTYKGEDFWVSEQIQEGVNAEAIDEIILSTNEHLLKEFDELIKKNL